MSSRFPEVALLAFAAVVLSAAHAPRTLRVCADPNNLPFSNARGEGFENRIGNIIAAELGARVEYTWWSQRRGFVRNTLNEGRCDVVMAVPTSLDLVLRTAPYYRSTYVFVTRASLTPEIKTFDDPRLRKLRIGVQMVGDDGANSPPAHALARRGIVDKVHGYMVYGDYSRANPLSPIVDAVETGAIDVAVVWGPVAGYFARHSRVPLRLTPVSPQIELPFLPFVFDIAVGVRRGDTTLRNVVDAAIDRRRDDIQRVLDAYAVPRVGAARRSTP